MTEQLSLLFNGAGTIEKEATACNQLFAFAGQKKPTPDPIEKPQA